MPKVKFKRLDHVQICIPKGKESEARKFYCEILGLKEIPKPEELINNGGLWFEICNIQLHIGVEDGVNKNTKNHPAFEIENLSEARKYFEEKGISINEEIKIPAMKRFSFRDPFGNRIELLEKLVLH